METDAAVLRMAGGQRRLFGVRHEQEDLFEQAAEAGSAGADEARDELAEFAYDTEDVHEFPGILREGSYHVVVGNPPYITVKDKKLNALYRSLYSACAGAYALSVPFAQRFFELARRADNDGRGAGYVGQITSNSFMKREFGKTLIEEFFAKEVELTHIIDSSGAYIPGHGTPTVIIFGRSRKWKRREKIRVIMGIRGEAHQPKNPADGLVWKSIVVQIDHPDSESDWLSTADVLRSEMNEHPWSLSGGGAKELLGCIERAAKTRLTSVASNIGFGAVTREDSAYMIGEGALRRHRVPEALRRPLVEGEAIRDWSLSDPITSLWPYDTETLEAKIDRNSYILIWPYRTILSSRIAFGKTQISRGLNWYEYSMFFRNRFKPDYVISTSAVATHNHFILDRRKNVFKDTAVTITLPEKEDEDRYLEITGILNTSTACFWLNLVCHDKGNRGGERSSGRYAWERYHQYNGTRLAEFPLPKTLPLENSRKLDSLAQHLTTISAEEITTEAMPARERLKAAQDEWHSVRAQMIALQEELDWEVYSLYGLLDDDLTAPADAVPELKLGERAFEIVLARRMARGETETQWFKRHGSTPIVELPDHWSPEYRAVVERRIALIETDRNIGLIEQPECKRRWAIEGWDAMQAKALRGWLLDRCEARELWFHHLDGIEQPRVLTTAQLADLLRPDADFVSVAELYAPGKDLEKVVADLVADEHVPYLAQLRYKDSGLVKRADWEDVWERQRREDAAQAVADAAGEAAKRQREVVEALDAADDAAENGGKHDEERERAHAEWVRLSSEHRKAEDEVRRIRNAIPVPPKYGSGDFLKTSYWRNRGKLDVPKERFVSYPHASRDGDPALLLGWAGWDHREQAQALATLVVDREQSHGWGAERLAPLLAGLREVLPWVRQWHDEFDHMYGATPPDLYEGFLVQTRDRLHLTDDDLTAWRPPKTARARRQ
ncbi:BREX-2 system adenine-specific DNA-methyltransferase PglX [Streptosporangium sp. NPDC048047]|uniref:BREX-2 system adenine-specific DNA-methyltransferase PglX n=1 Tax=Streptosporangium sp. NPDC048047 TaxID=3155748 RepID=UPI0034474160